MEKEDVMIELLKEISGRLSRVEEQQKLDREENNRRFEKIDSQFEKVDSRFEKIDSQFEKVDSRFEKMEEQRKIDKKEVLDKISSFEANANLHFTSLSNALAYERTRVDVIYDERKEVTVNWSTKIMALNSTFAGIVAFVVSSFK